MKTTNKTSGTSLFIEADTKPKANGDANEIVVGYNSIERGSNTAI